MKKLLSTYTIKIGDVGNPIDIEKGKTAIPVTNTNKIEYKPNEYGFFTIDIPTGLYIDLHPNKCLQVELDITLPNPEHYVMNYKRIYTREELLNKELIIKAVCIADDTEYWSAETKEAQIIDSYTKLGYLYVTNVDTLNIFYQKRDSNNKTVDEVLEEVKASTLADLDLQQVKVVSVDENKIAELLYNLEKYNGLSIENILDSKYAPEKKIIVIYDVYEFMEEKQNISKEINRVLKVLDKDKVIELYKKMKEDKSKNKDSNSLSYFVGE